MDIYDRIAQTAAQADHEPRVVSLVKELHGVRQGDLYLWRVASTDEREPLAELLRSAWPEFHLGKIGERTSNRQLAPGTTRGSRHEVADGDARALTIYAPSRGGHPCEGPLIVADGRFSVVHPEHAEIQLPAGTYQVIYQRDWAFEAAQRVQD